MASERGRLRELAVLFGRLGVVAFGGPAAHIAMTHDEVVTRRGWMTDQHFLDLVGATNLVPGPNSTEMTMHVGHHRAGWRGLVVAGASFILPAALIVGVLAALYVEYGATPNGRALLEGVTPVVVVVILQAVVRLGRTALRDVTTVGVAVTVAGLYLLGVHELVVLFGGALVVLAVRTVRRRGLGGLAAVVAAPVGLGDGGLPALVLQPDAPLGLGRLFLVFAKVGALLYGSGYVLLAFLRADLVERLGVLTDQQLLDAVAVGQFTPGPVFTTATFIGYVLAGVPGAVVATVGIFLPAFCFVGVLTRIVPHLRDRPWTGDLLDGVNAASLGLMAAVLVELAGDAFTGPLAVVLAAGSAVALWRTGLNSAWLVAAGAVMGLVAGASG